MQSHQLWLIVCLSVAVLPTSGEAKAFAHGKRLFDRYCGLTIGLDVYESYASVFCNIGRGPFQEVEVEHEMAFYWRPFLRSFKPHYLLVQATDYPLTHLAARVKRDDRGLYHDLDWELGSTETNVLDILASG